MSIHFPEEYQQELFEVFGLDPTEIMDVVNRPEKVDTAEIDGLSLLFYQKWVPQIPNPYYLLVYGRLIEWKFHVEIAWKIYPSLDENIADLQPLELLEVFANKFGMPVSIGPVRKKFFFDESVRLPKENWRESIAVDNPAGHEYVQQIFTKADEYKGEIRLTCGLGLCIDVEKYRTWMANV